MLLTALGSAFASAAVDKFTGTSKKVSDRTAEAISFEGAKDRAVARAKDATRQASVGITKPSARANTDMQRIIDQIYIPAMREVPDLARAIRNQAIAEGRSKAVIASIDRTFSETTEGPRKKIKGLET